MTALAVCSALIGLALGIRFRFFILLPFLFLGSIALTTLSIVQDWSQAQALWSILLFAAALQGGICLQRFVEAYDRPRDCRRQHGSHGEPEASLRPESALRAPVVGPWPSLARPSW
ncbi:hypothetical protein [Bradyrhizobium centrolobii]|uniref:hypothetical protein n=1 Tax=Bradyrhizobium centrolobii TaxID=1505087 RepID=UPI0010A959C3|nr:hypothetical protein [Bradyrhizobium centrolobii]